MPVDGLMIGFAQREANQVLQGGRIDKITQPEKDILILQIRSLGENHKLLLCASPNFPRIQLTKENFNNPVQPPMFCMLMRKHFQGGIIQEITQIQGDRYVKILIKNRDELGEIEEKAIYVELMGRHSNIIAVHPNGKIIDSIRHVSMEMSRVRTVLPGLTYEKPPMQDKISPLKIDEIVLTKKISSYTGLGAKGLGSAISGLSAVTSEEIYFRATGNPKGKIEEENIEGFIKKITNIFNHLEEMKVPQVVFDEQGNMRDILPFSYSIYEGLPIKKFSSIGDAMDSYYSNRNLAERLGQKSTALLKLIKTQIERCERKILLQQEALNNSEKMEQYRIAGDLVNANSYQIKKGDESAYLQNFYDPEGKMIEIVLDSRLSPTENAQKYFKKYQKAKSAQKIAAIQIEKTQNEIIFLENTYEDAKKSTSDADLMEVREELYQAGYIKNAQRKSKPQGKSKPYRYQSQNHIDILVGKNAVQNDRITFGGKSEETWLHAKDMPGSHVMIKESGPIPEETLFEAAQLAAFYSKGREGSQVPIDYTLRKYVKKPSGAPKGFVTYTQQKTLYITVTQQDIQNIKLVEG